METLKQTLVAKLQEAENALYGSLVPDHTVNKITVWNKYVITESLFCDGVSSSIKGRPILAKMSQLVSREAKETMTEESAKKLLESGIDFQTFVRERIRLPGSKLIKEGYYFASRDNIVDLT